MVIWIIIGAIALLAITFAIKEYRRTKTLELKTFLHGFGVDLSEGFEALWIAFRTLILLGLQGLFAHLEAATLHQLMPYREDSYLMGMGFALVAMVCGMTAAVEIKLQSDRKNVIKPAIEDLQVVDWYKDFMMKKFEKKYRTGWYVVAFNTLIAIGMHATIVLIAVFSLSTHEKYVMLVANGDIQPLEGVPVLYYTGYFGSPLLISSIFIGSLGLGVEFLLGLVSNVKEELYKYKPDMEIVNTTRDIENEYGDGEYDDDEDDEEEEDEDEEEIRNSIPKRKVNTKDETDINKPTEPKKEEVSKESLNEFNKFFSNCADQVKKHSSNFNDDDVEGFNYTGTEDVAKLIENIIEVMMDNTVAPDFELDASKLIESYNKAEGNIKSTAESAIKTQYKKALDLFREWEKHFRTIENGLEEYAKYITRKGDIEEKELKFIKSKVEPEVTKFNQTRDKLEKQFKDIVGFFTKTEVFK